MGPVWQGSLGGENYRLKGVWSGSHDPLKIFKPPSIFMEWMKPYYLNFAIASTTASATQGVKNSPVMGVVSVT